MEQSWTPSQCRDVGVDEEVLDAYKRKLETETNMNLHRSKAHRDTAKAKEDGGQPAKKKRKQRAKKGAAEANAEAPQDADKV